MLRTNLSTRPFYNERLVHVVLGAVAILVVALTAFNALRLQALTAERSSLTARIRDAENRTAVLRAETTKAERGINRERLAQVVAAAREANALIDERIFSWTELLNRLETTLPDAVRVQAIKPGTDRTGHMSVQLVVTAHQAEDIESFIERLEDTKAFEHVLSRSEAVNEQGLIEATLEGWYRPGAAPAGAVKK